MLLGTWPYLLADRLTSRTDCYRSPAGWHHRNHAEFETSPCRLRSFLAVCSESLWRQSIDQWALLIGAVLHREHNALTTGKSLSVPWHNSRWRVGAASRRDGGKPARQVRHFVTVQRSRGLEGSVAKLARVLVRKPWGSSFAVAEDEEGESSFLDSLFFPSRALFPRILSVVCRWRSKWLSPPLEPQTSRIRIAHLQKEPHPRLT